jgi:hypothetical protein
MYFLDPYGDDTNYDKMRKKSINIVRIVLPCCAWCQGLDKNGLVAETFAHEEHWCNVFSMFPCLSLAFSLHFFRLEAGILTNF